MARRFRDTLVRRWPMVRHGLAHPATSGLAFLWMTGLHERWLERSAHVGEVISGYGASLVLLGVFIGSAPYIRSGVEQMIEKGLPRYGGGFYGSQKMLSDHKERVARARPGATLDVWTERVIAVMVIVIGTFLNGYGTPLARRWGLPV